MREGGTGRGEFIPCATNFSSRVNSLAGGLYRIPHILLPDTDSWMRQGPKGKEERGKEEERRKRRQGGGWERAQGEMGRMLKMG